MALYLESKVVVDLFLAIQKKQKVYETSLQFSKQRTDDERVEFAYKLLEYEGIFSNLDFIKSGKKTEVATALRNEGNKEFQKKNDEIALQLYNKSMCCAPLDGKEYALAVGNRSAVNFSLRCYNACLKDIDQAFSSGYPKELHFKLFCRKVKCFIALKNEEGARETLKEAENILYQESPSNLSQQKSLLNQLEKDIQNPSSPTETKEESPEDCLKITCPDCSFEQNEEILCASSCVELKYDTQLGRHIVATQDINPGHVLVVEKPFASVLLPDSYFTHCFYCLKRCFSPVPCQHCALVLFCDENCRKKSWDQHHRIDCPLLPTISNAVGKMGLLALKVLLTAVQRETDLVSLYHRAVSFEKLCVDPRCYGFDSDGHYDSFNYHTAHTLIGNTELRTNDDLFRRAIIAGCLLHCLDKLTCFFDGITKSSNGSSNGEISSVQLKFFAGGLLLRYLQSIPCNAHEVAELVYRVSPVEDSTHEIRETGAGLYPALSLLNHSCDPNVVRFSYLDSSILIAIRSINAGEQIVDNYGYHYALHTLNERRQQLEQQYYFTCKCEACAHDWPLFEDLPNEPATIICSCGSGLQDLKDNNGIVRCRLCGDQTNVSLLKSQIDTSVEKWYLDTISRVVSDPPKPRGKDIENVVAHMLLLDRVRRPWRHYGGCQELLKMYFLLSASHCIFRA